MQPSVPRSRRNRLERLRFAHPFFTTVPLENRPQTPFGRRMTDHIQQALQPIPKPTRTPTFSLADIVGGPSAAEIELSGALRFHAVGDTGRRLDSPQGEVADAMTRDFDINQPATSPAFFFHLGDVIYGHSKDQKYRQEFYEPYMHYPGKIIAIPGNHDGEVFPQTDPKTLRAFRDNFCAPTAVVPPIAGTIFRQTMTQPSVFWLLDAPFVQIVGLYSNVAENPGFISGTIPGTLQKTWLVSSLKAIAKARQQGQRKALIIATHHPPFSTGGHSGSPAMLADIDDACLQAKIMPDLFLSAHSHTYQRYSRRVTLAGQQLDIPFLVAGMGGINDQDVPTATGQTVGDHTFVKSRKGFGYLLVEVAKSRLTAHAIGVSGTQKAEFDSVTVSL
jgi:calcineurin-like phosphoesterase family protein